MFKTLDEIECRGRCVLVRGDLNVPMQDGLLRTVRGWTACATVRELRSERRPGRRDFPSWPPEGRG